VVLRRILLYPFALIYGGILELRNSFYNLGIFKIGKVDAPIISIGNLSMGGTGKTPHVNFVVDKLKQNTKVGVLLRGYGRKSKGVIRVTNNSTAQTVGDEALLYKRRHKDEVEVVVAEKRILGADLLLKSKNGMGLIVLDDAFQHRSIHRDLDILLVDYNRPFWKDTVLPAGNLREFSHQKKRADLILITKCPDDLDEEKKQQIHQKIKPKVHQEVYFSHIVYGDFIPFFKHDFGLPEEIVLVTGIANADPLKDFLEKIARVKHLCYPDHHDFNSKDIQEIHELFDKFATNDKVIVTTEKDYMRLISSGFEQQLKKYPWFYKEISVELDREKDFLKRLKNL
jgi:tetraacyldisaccharide 4'-kinase